MNEDDARYQERAKKIDALRKQYDNIVAQINRRNIDEETKLELIIEAGEALQAAIDRLG